MSLSPDLDTTAPFITCIAYFEVSDVPFLHLRVWCKLEHSACHSPQSMWLPTRGSFLSLLLAILKDIFLSALKISLMRYPDTIAAATPPAAVDSMYVCIKIDDEMFSREGADVVGSCRWLDRSVLWYHSWLLLPGVSNSKMLTAMMLSATVGGVGLNQYNWTDVWTTRWTSRSW